MVVRRGNGNLDGGTKLGSSDFSKKGSGKSAEDRLFCSRSCRAHGVGPFTVVALDARPESQTMRRADSALFTRGIR